MQNFKLLIKSDQIVNCLVAMEDIKIVEKIHGKDISHRKDKTMRRNLTTTTTMTIATPRESKECNENVTSHIDMMCINEIGFMMSTSHPTCHCRCEQVTVTQMGAMA